MIRNAADWIFFRDHCSVKGHKRPAIYKRKFLAIVSLLKQHGLKCTILCGGFGLWQKSSTIADKEVIWETMRYQRKIGLVSLFKDIWSYKHMNMLGSVFRYTGLITC